MSTTPSTALLAPPQLVLLDRDGVINFDSPDYIKSPAEWRALPGALKAIARLNHAGILVGICSNQSGVGRGLFDTQMLSAIHQKLEQELAAAGGHLDHIGICPHAPQVQCNCRKPKPGLLISALKVCQVEPSSAVFIGDSLRDLQAASAAGVQPMLVRTGNGRRTEAELTRCGRAAPTFDDLALAVDDLLRAGAVDTARRKPQ